MIRPRGAMRLAVTTAACAFVVLILACQPKSGEEPARMTAAAADSAAEAGAKAALDRGRQGYLGYCGMCHGEWGTGDGPLAAEMKAEVGAAPVALNLHGRVREIGRADVIEIIRQGGDHTGRSSRMPGWEERLDEELIGDIADFVMTLPDLKRGPATEVVEQFMQAPAGSPAEGRRLFVFYCSSCHGPFGRGDGTLAGSLWTRNRVHPRDLTDSGYFAGKKDSDIYASLSLGGAHTGGSPSMPAWSASLTPAQISDLVSYVRTISRARPVR